MNLPTFHKFLESPYDRQKLMFNQIRKSSGSFSDWQTQLIEVCKAGKIDNLKLLSLKPFCERYISELKSKNFISSSKKEKVQKKSKVKDSVSFLIENDIPERYANLFTGVSIFDLKQMGIKDLTAINGIGKSTAKKIAELPF